MLIIFCLIRSRDRKRDRFKAIATSSFKSRRNKRNDKVTK